MITELKTPHEWTIEEIDGGSVGIADFWHCPRCGASGGPVWGTRNANSMCFLAGTGLQLSSDCSIAMHQIYGFIAGFRYASSGHAMPRLPENTYNGFGEVDP